VRSAVRLGQTARILALSLAEGGLDVRLELTGGMGRALTPAPGSVPGIADQVTCSTVSDAFRPAGQFPEVGDTPWTHGGPPVPPTPTEDDAVEDWS